MTPLHPSHILWKLLSALLFLLLPSVAWPEQTAYLERLVQEAERQKIHEEREWEVLLHYGRTFSGGRVSRIDDPTFFLSPTGKTDPREELVSTLRSFFVTPRKDGSHSSCRFPARFRWLQERLSLDSAQLPPITCSERDAALAAVQGRSAVLVFPVGHINSPASMFGHTLIRLDGAGSSRLLSYAANYAATAEDTNGFVYAWKGLSGKYKGYYSLLPYYLKVKEYSDMEHRDMWEYGLRLSPEEVETMLNHLWELQGIHSSYFFLDENCSYNLLFLVEVARPDLRLTDRTGVFVLPTQTIRILLESGILEEPHYRPSQGTRIAAMLSRMEKDRQETAYRLAHGTGDAATAQSGDSPEERAAVLDLAAEYVQVRFARKELTKEDYSRLYLQLLRVRSRLGTAGGDSYAVAEPPRPEAGHDTTRVAAGAGVRRGRGFAELGLQPEFHALMDPDNGYLRGAQIKFFDTALRYVFAADQLRLEKLYLLDIVSIAPRNMFFRPVSWKIRTGFDRVALQDGRDHLLYRLGTGGGHAVSSPFGGIWYAFAEVDIQAGDAIRGWIAAGPGFSAGGIEQPADWWKVHLSVRGFLYPLGDDRTSLSFSAAQNFRLTRNNSLTLDYEMERVNSQFVDEARLLWNHYF